MEKEALINELKAKVGEDNFSVLSGQTVDALVTTFLPSFADDEKITNDTWKLPVEVCKNYVGQYRHDLATKAAEEKARLEREKEEAVKTLVEKKLESLKAEWEKEHKNVKEETDNKPIHSDKDDFVVKAIEEYNKKLFGEDGKSGLIGGQLKATSDFIAESVKATEAEKIKTIKQQLKDYLQKDRKASREPVVNLSVGDLEITPKSDINELKIEVEKIYEERYKEFYGDGGKPFGGDTLGGDNGDDTDLEVKKYLEARKKADEERTKILEASRQTFV